MIKKLAVAVAVAVAALAAWVAVGPFVTAKAIRTAVASNDEAQLDLNIDFPSVRDSLKSQLYGAVDDRGPPDQSGGFGNALKNIMGGALDVMLTPHGVLLLLQHKTALGNAPADESAPGPAAPANDK